MAGTSRSFEGTVTDVTAESFGTVRCELRTIETPPSAESVLYHADHTLLATIAGGADAVRVMVDGAPTYEGPKRLGSAGFFPASRRLVSVWPATKLTYLAMFTPHAEYEALTERTLMDGDWLPQGDLADPFVRTGLLELAAAMRRPASPIERLYIESVITAIQLRTVRSFSTFADVELKGSEPIDRVIEHIDAHLSEALSLADLGMRAGLSRGRLRRAFLERTGLTPYRFVTHRRIEMAKRLLSETDLSMAAIATMIGSADQSQLNVIFSKYVGMTPTAYRHYVGKKQ